MSTKPPSQDNPSETESKKAADNIINQESYDPTTRNTSNSTHATSNPLIKNWQTEPFIHPIVNEAREFLVAADKETADYFFNRLCKHIAFIKGKKWEKAKYDLTSQATYEVFSFFDKKDQLYLLEQYMNYARGLNPTKMLNMRYSKDLNSNKDDSKQSKDSDHPIDGSKAPPRRDNQ